MLTYIEIATTTLKDVQAFYLGGVHVENFKIFGAPTSFLFLALKEKVKKVGAISHSQNSYKPSLAIKEASL